MLVLLIGKPSNQDKTESCIQEIPADVIHSIFCVFNNTRLIMLEEG